MSRNLFTNSIKDSSSLKNLDSNHLPMFLRTENEEGCPSISVKSYDKMDSKKILQMGSQIIRFDEKSIEIFEIGEKLKKMVGHSNKPIFLSLECKYKLEKKPNVEIKVGFFKKFLCAIKCLQIRNEKKITYEESFLMILREIKNMEEINKLDSEYFVKIKDYFPQINPNINSNYISSINIIMEEAEFSLREMINYILNLATENNFTQSEINDIFLNIFIIIDQVIKAVKILKKADYINCDLKEDNILIANSNNKYLIKIADFATLITPKEYKKNNSLRGWTRGYVPKYFDDETYVGAHLSDKALFMLDIYSLKKLCSKFINKLVKCEKFFSNEQEEVLKLFLINLLNVNENLEENESIEDLENKFNGLLIDHKIDIKEKALEISNKIIRQMLINKFRTNSEESVNELLIKYLKIGFYSKPLNFCLEDMLRNEKDANISYLALGKIYNLLKNNEKSFYYYKKYLEEVSLNKIPHSQISILLAKSEIATIYLISGSEGRDKASKIADEIMDVFIIDEIVFKSSDTKDIIINLIYIYAELGKLDMAEKITQQTSKLIQNNKDFQTDYENPLGNNFYMNNFMYKFYNVQAMLIRNNQKFKTDKQKIIEEIDFMEKALAIVKMISSEYAIGLAQIYNNTGCSYHRTLDFEKALDYHKISYEIRKNIRNIFPETGISWVLIPYSMIAFCYFYLKRYEESLIIIKEIYDERVKISLEDSILLIQTRYSLMKTLIMLKKTKEAKKIYDELIKTFSMKNLNCGKYEKKWIENRWNKLTLKIFTEDLPP